MPQSPELVELVVRALTEIFHEHAPSHVAQRTLRFVVGVEWSGDDPFTHVVYDGTPLAAYGLASRTREVIFDAFDESGPAQHVDDNGPE